MQCCISVVAVVLVSAGVIQGPLSTIAAGDDYIANFDQCPVSAPERCSDR